MADLSTYLAQLAQVEQLLASEPGNSAFQKLRSDLQLLIQITQRAGDDGEPGIQSSVDSQRLSSSSLHVGDVVEVKGDDRVYAGVITKVDDDEAQVIIGDKFLCKYSQDQQYYEAVISEITLYGVKVTYTAYGSSEEVPIQYLKPINVRSTSKASDGSDNIGQGKLIAIPEHLLVKPTDTEEEKERKRRKVKAIKSKNKTIEINNMFAKSQQSWQSFKDKGAKKSLAGLVKTSIFTSTDKDDKKQVTEYERKRNHFHTSRGSN